MQIYRIIYAIKDSTNYENVWKKSKKVNSAKYFIAFN